jgi:tRNA pseudouridine synthase 10
MENSCKFALCAQCASRFRGKESKSRVAVASQDSECFICQGLLSNAGHLVLLAASQSQGFDWGTFAVSSSFPKKVFVREQKVADYFLPQDFSSLKNSANALLASELSAATGKQNTQRTADAMFEFNFIKGLAFAKPMPLYVSGHYLKLSRKHCQSRWHCSDCGGKGCESCKGSGMNYPSVEDEIGKVLMNAFAANGCSLHASGREDVDVRMLGTGRPFVMELKNPKKRSVDLKALEKTFEANDSVRAVGMKMVEPHFINAVCGSHFDKEYSALVSADRKLTQKDAREIEGLSGTLIFQETPTRVLSRRADMVRKRRVHRISVVCEKEGKLRLTIFAEAGTYIKELIHSDDGRTKPSISELLSCKCACDELDVVRIDDYFLETVSA